jgi:hypothetical protein
VQSGLSINFKNLKLEVDTQRMMQQLQQSNYDESVPYSRPIALSQPVQ